jgi:hypothetical protein
LQRNEMAVGITSVLITQDRCILSYQASSDADFLYVFSSVLIGLMRIEYRNWDRENREISADFILGLSLHAHS